MKEGDNKGVRASTAGEGRERRERRERRTAERSRKRKPKKGGERGGAKPKVASVSWSLSSGKWGCSPRAENTRSWTVGGNGLLHKLQKEFVVVVDAKVGLML